jgi:hypothetical protein
VSHTIVVGGTANALTYNIGAAQSISIEAVNATIDTTGMALGTTTSVDVIFRDNAQLLVSRSRSSRTLGENATYAITFAPWLPDTYELGNAGVGYVITSGLCATTLPAGGSVTVQPVDPLAIVKGFRMWVEDEEGGSSGTVEIGDFMLVPGPGA